MTGIEIQKLITCLPNPETYQDGLIQSLVGTHQYGRVSGSSTHQMDVTIHSVQVVQEGYGATYSAVADSILQPGEGYTAFFDLGRGTAIYWLVDRSTLQVIPNSRGVIRKGGLQLLLSMLQQEPSLQEVIGRQGDASLDILHKAILNGTFVYGKTGHNFKDAYNYYSSQWLTKIKDEALTAWSSGGWVDEIYQLIFVGGAAPVANVWATDPEKNDDGWIVVMPNSQTCSVSGMLCSVTDANQDGLVYAVDPGNGWIKFQSNQGHQGLIESALSPVFSRPKIGSVNESSVYLEHPKFKGIVGNSAKQTLNSNATVNQDKGLIALPLILSAIQPQTVAKTATKRGK